MLEILEQVVKKTGCSVSLSATEKSCDITVSKDSIIVFELTTYNYPTNPMDIQELIDETAISVLAELTNKGINSINLN